MWGRIAEISNLRAKLSYGNDKFNCRANGKNQRTADVRGWVEHVEEKCETLEVWT